MPAHAHARSKPRARHGRSAMLLLLLLAVFAAGLKGDPIAERYHRLAAKLRCTCGCQQSLLQECNNMQCSARAQLDASLIKLGRQVRTSDSDDLILQSFVQEYGADVLAAPSTHGFSLVVWVMPWVAAGLGLWALLFAIRYWRQQRASEPLPAAPGRAPDPALARVRAELDRELEDWEHRP